MAQQFDLPPSLAGLPRRPARPKSASSTRWPESDTAQLIKTEPGEAGAYCTFETVAGDIFTVFRPPSCCQQRNDKEDL